ncbi:Rab5-interacting protein (Rab5ip) [Novymonas esmeraldas]|uniref:ER membrane protein complex subunit 6 n=1 Tax=Novymonas esmeraldas TaxID=1808958 RepID=A0AAW0EY09_9TRYP
MSTPDDRFVGRAVGKNYEAVFQIRTMGSLLAGVAAGVLGLTNFWGLFFFVVSAAVTSFAIVAFGCGGNAHKCFPKGTSELFSVQQLLSGAMTYILVWTVAYDAIYIF